jgi:hypothetical protein
VVFREAGRASRVVVRLVVVLALVLPAEYPSGLLELGTRASQASSTVNRSLERPR